MVNNCCCMHCSRSCNLSWCNHKVECDRNQIYRRHYKSVKVPMAFEIVAYFNCSLQFLFQSIQSIDGNNTHIHVRGLLLWFGSISKICYFLFYYRFVYGNSVVCKSIFSFFTGRKCSAVRALWSNWNAIAWNSFF